MTDALTNAERLLRKAADDVIYWPDHEPLREEFTAAADALAAERERRGEPVAWQVMSGGEPTDRVAHSKEKGELLLRDLGRGPYSSVYASHYTIRPLYAAPPLPPATARDDGGMSGAFIVVGKRDGRVMGDCSTLAEAEALRRDCIAADETSEYAVASFVPPATGEGENVAAVLESHRVTVSSGHLFPKDGGPCVVCDKENTTTQRAADAVKLAQSFADIVTDARGRKSYEFDDHNLRAYAERLRPTPEPSEAMAPGEAAGRIIARSMGRLDDYDTDVGDWRSTCDETALEVIAAARPTPEPSEAMVEAVEKEKDALRASSATYHSSIYVVRLTEAFAALDRIAALAAQEGK